MPWRGTRWVVKLKAIRTDCVFLLSRMAKVGTKFRRTLSPCGVFLLDLATGTRLGEGKAHEGGSTGSSDSVSRNVL
ncbi:hypothetical protein LEMLEM_LOCUS20138 [Lemmus lemmus]